MTVYILTENEPNEGGEPVGVYSTPERAEAAAAERTLASHWYYLIHPVELDAPQKDLDSFGPSR